MRTFSDLIDKLGTARVAVVLGVDDSHVRTMKARDSVAPEFWARLISEAEKQELHGVTWEKLSKLRQARFAPNGRRERARASA